MDDKNFLGSYSISLGASTIESRIGEKSSHADNTPSQSLNRSGAAKLCICFTVVAVIIVVFILGGILASLF